MAERKLTTKEKNLIKRYPNTDYFQWTNTNPVGNITYDCLIRACSSALDTDWTTVSIILNNMATNVHLVFNDDKLYESFLHYRGFNRQKQPRKANNKKYTGVEFCEYLTKYYPNGEVGPIVAYIGTEHIVCIKFIDGKYKVLDTWDSSHNCIGVFYCQNNVQI